MPTEHIIALLRAERDRLDAALRALEGGSTTKRRGRPRKIADDANMPDWVRPKAATVPKKKGRKYTAKQRREASARMKARWAAKKKAPAKRKNVAKAKTTGGNKAMYEVFDNFLKTPNWHSNHDDDEDRFFCALKKVVIDPKFDPDGLGDYMDEKREAGEKALQIDQGVYEEARDRYIATAHAVRGYLRVNCP